MSKLSLFDIPMIRLTRETCVCGASDESHAATPGEEARIDSISDAAGQLNYQ